MGCPSRRNPPWAVVGKCRSPEDAGGAVVDRSPVITSMSVATHPGQTEFTRIPLGASSAANMGVRALSATFDTW